MLTVFPYYGFWSWMTDRAAKYVDIYYIVYGGKDMAVFPELHARKFKVRMEEYGHDITVIEAPESGHIYPYAYPAEIKDAYFGNILKFCL